jgi:general secretion pathway protein G
MALVTPTGDIAPTSARAANDPRAGFSLMEMIIVVAIIGTLAGVVAPAVIASVRRAREAALQQDLTIIRKLIDDYHADRNLWPPTLDALVKDGYMRAVPGDPVNNGRREWLEVKSKDGGIEDIHSLSNENGANGLPYSQW